MATLDVGQATAILKEYYSNQRVTQMTYKDAPLYAMLTKVKDFSGRIYPLPMRVTNPQGRSSTFANAQSQKIGSNYKEFSLVRAKDYSLASISSEAIMASENDAGAFLRLATAEIDGALDSLKRALGWAIYGDGSGAIGTIASYSLVGGFAVIALSQVEDVVKFEIGQTLEVRSGATLRSFSTGVSITQVSKVDRDQGIVTLAAISITGSDIVANDTTNVVGDYNTKLTGLAGWLPKTTPTSALFFGVDRTADATRLGGVRNSAIGKPMDEALIDAARRAGREGGSPDYGFLGFSRYAQLEKTLGSRVIYSDVEVAGVGFRGIEISGPNGKIVIMPDRDCPENTGYLLQMDTFALYSLKEPVMILDMDGNKMLRESSADAYEIRCATFSQLGCTFPGANVVISF